MAGLEDVEQKAGVSTIQLEELDSSKLKSEETAADKLTADFMLEVHRSARAHGHSLGSLEAADRAKVIASTDSTKVIASTHGTKDLRIGKLGQFITEKVPQQQQKK